MEIRRIYLVVKGVNWETIHSGKKGQIAFMSLPNDYLLIIFSLGIHRENTTIGAVPIPLLYTIVLKEC